MFSDDAFNSSFTRFAEGMVLTGSSKDITSRPKSGSFVPRAGST